MKNSRMNLYSFISFSPDKCVMFSGVRGRDKIKAFVLRAGGVRLTLHCTLASEGTGTHHHRHILLERFSEVSFWHVTFETYDRWYIGMELKWNTIGARSWHYNLANGRFGFDFGNCLTACLTLWKLWTEWQFCKHTRPSAGAWPWHILTSRRQEANSDICQYLS